MSRQKVSEQTANEAMAVAKATQRPNQTKEQTKLIAKGIEKGIAEYKKRQKDKSRELDKKRKKLDSKAKELNDMNTMEQPQLLDEQPSPLKSRLVCALGYVLFVLSLLWNVFYSSAAQAAESRKVAQQDLVYMMTSDGLIIYELLPQVAPNHAKRFKNLANEGFYDGLDFYRVIDGFVAQAGEGEPEWDNVKGKTSKFNSMLKAELTRPLSTEFVVAQSPELLAPETGYIDSVPAGRDPKTKEEWFLHCPGMVAMARNNEIDSGATEFYINIGQAPRHLDRNMSVFARVVSGLEVAQRMTRGDRAKGGIVADRSKRSKILWAKTGDKVAEEFKKSVEVQLTTSKAFQQRLNDARNKTHAFYVYAGNGNIDVCYYQPIVTVN
jgi:peptidylprolyl isomerase